MTHLITLGLFVPMYLLGSFYSTSFDITEWKDATRFLTILIYAGVVLFRTAFIVIKKEEL